jgi:hypothetical protein
MTQQDLLKEFVSLPLDAQRQVADFVTFLHQKYKTQTPSRENSSSLREDKFIGMWRDRKDLSDSTEWVENVRAKEWTR